MNTSPAIALTIIGICLAYGEPVVLGETMDDNGRVTGIYVLESDNLLVEKSIYHGRGMRPPFWVEVELADARGVLQRKMFRLDPGVGPVAVDDRVTVKSAALVFDRSGGLLPQVDRVTEVHPRKRDAAALSAGQ
jgi:hypothetical protein